jgi:hypothetical protein
LHVRPRGRFSRYLLRSSRKRPRPSTTP